MSYTTIPYVIAFANEERRDRLVFQRHAGSDDGVRLAYEPRHKGDRIGGILRARVDNLRSRPNARGPERMRKLNTRRQWECMDYLLCQVCRGPATDPDTGRIWWALVPTVFESTLVIGDDWWVGRTNAPPTCKECIPKALEECPMLAEHARIYTVAEVEPSGVLADMYEPGPGLLPIPVPGKRNVYVAWDAFSYHARALAVAQVVHLYGMVRVQ
ncbi:hypothetical protein [Nonomuraea pusilla]|uniref:Uncharacterized protein n=1 Tax=Nonomuraea pusilla TaxID=46177 RepID=A0A1H8K951_9ACTN|nr:hypothetical protein [Nonomuraea pusilla]SEN89375.1 hypothetical protein SAMN05660976_08552 [Nonomuraea pusilla]